MRRPRSTGKAPLLAKSARNLAPTCGWMQPWLLQRVRGLGRLGFAIVFCNCFRDAFRPAFRARLFDNGDYVLIAQPHGAMRVDLYTIGVCDGLAAAFRRRSIGFPQS